MRRSSLLATLMLVASALFVVLFAEAGVFAIAAPGDTVLPAVERAVIAATPVTLRSDDSVHYAVHLVAGRLLSLCPCARKAAAVQYAKAARHARTEHQVALVTTARPHTLGSLVIDTLQLGVNSLKWVATRAVLDRE